MVDQKLADARCEFFREGADRAQGASSFLRKYVIKIGI
jgi:hypothetical protein